MVNVILLDFRDVMDLELNLTLFIIKEYLQSYICQSIYVLPFIKEQ